ncbi:hypothetical protein GCM10011391_09500 [Pullulanibacillus camelliae]|uniref:Class D sortase n=1 Tax=Pullulanibacillus camelliae TaxID=1707096 RepID=A0A8J2YG15_9BACL|nr:class D sortase [Pullulanibacillus camelliae]GGE32958.1 hypothetical protein GCM10011391_09500 [Pullulanibacillus camelliae]
MRYISSILIALGLILLFIGGYQFFHTKHQISQSFSDVKQSLEQPTEENHLDSGNYDGSTFNPKLDHPVGILKIPKLKRNLPIIEGTEQKELAKGVGHYTTTGFPGQGKPILLAGHRDTVFRDFGKLKKGDMFILNLPYGKYKYQMRNAKIVDSNNTKVVRDALRGTKEKLLISTCYPFGYIGHAPKRYVIYAYAVDRKNS